MTNLVHMVRESDELRLDFEPVLDISHVAQLRSDLDGALAAKTPLVLDGGRIERIDTAALQTIAVFCRSASDAGLRPRWHAASATLRDAAAMLQLTDHMGGLA